MSELEKTKGRGRLTDEVKKKSAELLGYEITVKELRLMPYIQYIVLNTQNSIINRISEEERKILTNWKELGYIDSSDSGLSITKKFWDILCEILWLSYVDINKYKDDSYVEL